MSTRTEDEEVRAKIFGRTLDESGRIRACSSSQVKTHKLCPRKWYYQKVLKRPKGPKGKGAQESTEAHDRMERFLKDGAQCLNDVEKFGLEMIQQWLSRAPGHAPDGKGDMMVEDPLIDPQLKTPGGVIVTGFFDACVPPSWDMTTFDENGNEPCIELPVMLDHKYLKDVDQWAATKESLETDEPQATMYMAWALTKWPNVPAIRFRHHNHQKKGRRYNKPVEVKQTREQVFARMAELGKYIDTEMQATAAIKNVHDVPTGKLPEACKAFGGCEFRGECAASPTNRFLAALHGMDDLPETLGLGSIPTNPQPQGSYNLMGLMDDIDEGIAPPTPSGGQVEKAAQTAAQTTPTVTVSTATAAVKPALKALEAGTAVKDGVYMMPGGVVAKCKGALDGKVMFVAKDKTMFELDPEDLIKDLNGDPVSVALFARKALIVDVSTTPDAELQAKQAAAKTAAANPEPVKVVDTTPKVDPKAGVIPDDAPPDTNPKTAEVKVSVEPAAQAAESKPAETTAAEPAKPAATETPATKGKGGRPKKSTTELTSGIVLIIDTIASGGEPLDNYVATMAAKLCEAHQLADLRLAPKGSDAAFLGWRGLMAIATKKSPPPPGIYTIRSGDLADPVIEALIPMCSLVVGRGRL